MTFCTIVEWNNVDLATITGLLSSGPSELPEGCLSKIVGPIGDGTCVIEVWRSGDDAARQAHNAPSGADFPPPTRVSGFEAATYETS